MPASRAWTGQMMSGRCWVLRNRNELLKFACLISGLTTDHGKGDVADICRAGLGGPAGPPISAAGANLRGDAPRPATGETLGNFSSR